MNLPTAAAVGFAVSDGQPADARSWLAIDFDGHLTPLKRGYLVATEPTERTPYGFELAAQVREIILGDLRRQQHAPVDIALGRAFARANGFVHNELTRGPHASFDHRIFVGATAVVIDDHTLTVAHVPPGQLIMIEDGLVYAVPELESWLPTWNGNGAAANGAPDPLGYSAQVRPHLAVTELRPGDVMAIADARTGEQIARRMAAQGGNASDMTGLYGHDPDVVLDVFREVVIQEELADASVAVLALPPLPGSLQIQTVGDVVRRARDGWHHTVAIAREWRPIASRREPANPFSSRPADAQPQSGGALKPITEIPEYAISSSAAAAGELPPTLPDGLKVRPDTARAERRAGLQERVFRFTERNRGRWKTTWQQPTETRQFGLPGAHGVELFRGTGTFMGESSWRNHLPRIPLISAGLIWILLVCTVAAAVLAGAFIYDRTRGSEEDFSGTFAQIDQQIVAALAITDTDARAAALQQTQVLIDQARHDGAPEEGVRQREHKVTAELDTMANVIRMSEVTRVGSWPEDLQSSPPQIVQTAIGTFIVSGSLYQLHPDTGVVERVLMEGDVVDSAPVGSLFAIAADTNGIYTTDGRHIFMRDGTGTWIATEMRELNQLGPWVPGPLDAFLSNVYLLVPQYLNIYKFQANPENGVASGEAWVTSGQEGLDGAVDIAIDGNIYVLMDDGEIRTYLRGSLEKTQMPAYIDGANPVALLSGGRTGYLYIAVADPDGRNGRVLAFDPVTEVTYQLELPIGFDVDKEGVTFPFEDVQDIAVDEQSGTMYITNGDSVWTTRYSLPQLPHMVPDATPEITG